MNINIPIDLLDELYNTTSNIKLKSVLTKRLTEIGFINNVKTNNNKCQIFIKLSIIIESLNEGWKPDFNDKNQCKYYNWFRIENRKFVFDDTYCDSGHITVPSTLYLKDKKTAIYCKNNFYELYKEYYM
jgi:hypothetical protein